MASPEQRKAAERRLRHIMIEGTSVAGTEIRHASRDYVRRDGTRIPAAELRRGFCDYIMPDGTRIPAVELYRLNYATVEWRGGRPPSLPWDDVLAAAAKRIDANGLHGHKLRRACSEALIAELTKRGLTVPSERSLRTYAKALAVECQSTSIIAEKPSDTAAD
jgi:hypothetical protein